MRMMPTAELFTAQRDLRGVIPHDRFDKRVCCSVVLLEI
jgi:hypothetical protein